MLAKTSLHAYVFIRMTDSKNTHILVLWSGGIDSNYKLAWLLNETSFSIHALHIDIVDRHNRHHAEQQAINQLLPKMKSIRPFEYSESGVSFSNFAIEDQKLWRPIVSLWCYGHYKNGTLTPFTHYTIGTHASEGHNWARWRALDPLFDTMLLDFDHLDTFPNVEFDLFNIVSKYQEIEYLRKLGITESWYCREPRLSERGYLPCGQCHTCKEVATAAREQV